MSASLALEMRGISKHYGRKRVLDKVDLTMSQSETVGLIGPNGAGKTTLLRILLGLVRPSEGTVRLAGCSPRAGPHALTVAYFGGEWTLPPTVSVRRWRRILGAPRVDGEDGRAFRLLSRGSRQLAGVKAALDRLGPRLLVLDEPYEGLDPDAARWLTETLQAKRARGIGSLVSSHRLHDLAGLCDRYAFLLDGRVVCLRPDEVAEGGHVTGATLLTTFDRLKDRKG